MCGQNVYVSCPRRIRFTLETYTFCLRYVYVRMGKGIRLTYTTDQVRDLDVGEGRRDCSWRRKKKPTVGRLGDLPWVGHATYSRFFQRPTVGYI